jgi:nitroimidazol reductase NimA-like FMN-containing flavoprotein (pyridoxamine 5'-phosphate oxidase superfamily)
VTQTADERTRIRRVPENAVHDRTALDAVLDAGLVAHVAIVDNGQPFVLPVGYARRGDEVIVHGSSGSRLFRALAEGASTCITVTILDGLVYARSVFHSSMNYRSAMVLGHGTRLTDDDELDALRVLSDHLLPGRWEHARGPSKKERAATLTISVPITEWSLKVGTGGPEDDDEDITAEPWRSLWAGYVPIDQAFGEPVPDSHVPPGTQAPDYLPS